MTNPYMDRIRDRMEADDAVGKLHRHWSARGEKLVNRVGYRLERAGFERLASWYTDFTAPLVDWFAGQQARFLRRWL